ncbi:MAG: hypothetical protein GY816_23340 [Cytophagales bacterium]|nr:hypothetical protein [Cytophagales bacterium]
MTEQNYSEDQLLGICTAYESGYGHGLDSRDLPNPYPKNTSDHWAYGHGYSEGRQAEQTVLKEGMNKENDKRLAAALAWIIKWRIPATQHHEVWQALRNLGIDRATLCRINLDGVRKAEEVE